MKLLLALLAILATAVMMSGAGPGVTYIGNDKVADSLAKGGMLVTQSDLTVQGAHRAAAGQVKSTTKKPMFCTSPTARPLSSRVEL